MRQEAEYSKLLQSMVLDGAEKDRLTSTVKEITRKKSFYENAKGIPWQLIGVIHEMECGGDTTRQILNGEKWSVQTTKVPKGMGPYASFDSSLVDAIQLKFPRYTVEWTMPFCLYFLESWNGWGYYKRGLQSPYLWAGTNHGVNLGKFVADGKYDPNAKSAQLGAAPILAALMNVAEQPSHQTIIYYDPSGGLQASQGDQVKRLQSFLNDVLPTGVLTIDGKAGPKTDAVFFRVFGQHLLGWVK